jgi:hypothetical protein
MLSTFGVPQNCPEWLLSAGCLLTNRKANADTRQR